MLSYTFSKREKVLLAILAIILVAIAWFMLVYQNSASEVFRLQSQIADAESSISLDTGRVVQMENMQAEIEQFKAQGARQTEVPAYDNLQPLMVELNNVMAMTDTYSLSFDAIDTSSESYIERGVTITYGCASYDRAEAVVNALAYGTFPCSIDSVSIVDGSANTLRGGSGSSTSASIHVTFYEKA